MRLPPPKTRGETSLEETLERRRSNRSFTSQSLSWEQISQLLWAAQGITGRHGLRSAPSAGALYPLEIYLVIMEGVYHYKPEGQELEQILDHDVRPQLCRLSTDRSDD